MYTKTRDLGFGNEVKRRIILGTFVLSSGYYDKTNVPRIILRFTSFPKPKSLVFVYIS
jgi:Asp-tRNA(Asn)/Glu-tRNA(Gln) amidotransferase A subunit family amidase